MSQRRAQGKKKAPTMRERLERFDAMAADGRIKRDLRRWWSRTDDDGREIAWMLDGLVPEVGASRNTSKVPVDVMPRWLADVVKTIEEHASEEAWPDLVLQFASLARRWHAIEDWRWFELAIRCLAVLEARSYFAERAALSHDGLVRVAEAFDAVLEWLEADAPSDDRLRVNGLARLALQVPPEVKTNRWGTSCIAGAAFHASSDELAGPTHYAVSSAIREAAVSTWGDMSWAATHLPDYPQRLADVKKATAKAADRMARRVFFMLDEECGEWETGECSER